jgi:hypothetical protein
VSALLRGTPDCLPNRQQRAKETCASINFVTRALANPMENIIIAETAAY